MNIEIWLFDGFFFIAASFKLIIFIFNLVLCWDFPLIFPGLWVSDLKNRKRHHDKKGTICCYGIWCNNIQKKISKCKHNPLPTFLQSLTWLVNTILFINLCRSLTPNYWRERKSNSDITSAWETVSRVPLTLSCQTNIQKGFMSPFPTSRSFCIVKKKKV